MILQVNIVTTAGKEEIYFIGEAPDLFGVEFARSLVKPPRRSDIIAVKSKEIDEQEYHRLSCTPFIWYEPTERERIA